MNEDTNPFASPSAGPMRRYAPSTDPSIEHEPQQLGEEFLPDEADGTTPAASLTTSDEAVEHTVWDEPGLSPILAGTTPREALTYERWLRDNVASTTWRTSWLVTALVAMSSGLLAALGAWSFGFQVGGGLVQIGLVTPLIEEVLKIALLAWIVEKRPFLFKSMQQIIVAAACSGLVFSVVENFVYLNVYVADAPTWLIGWRWTVCVALHIGCSSCAAMGLIRIWRDCIHNAHQPRLPMGAPYLGAAVAIHAVYNTATVLASLGEYRF